MTKRVMWNRPKNKGPFPTFSQVNELPFPKSTNSPIRVDPMVSLFVLVPRVLAALRSRYYKKVHAIP